MFVLIFTRARMEYELVRQTKKYLPSSRLILCNGELAGRPATQRLVRFRQGIWCFLDDLITFPLKPFSRIPELFLRAHCNTKTTINTTLKHSIYSH